MIGCESCANNKTPIAIDTKSQQQCKQIDLIPNCDSYENQTKQLRCTHCRTNFWLDTVENECKAVTVIPFCTSYNPKADECIACESTHILSGNKKSCIIVPAGRI